MKKILFIMAVVMACITTAKAQYKVGDYYEKDGLKGIVVRVDASGSHGLIMSLERTSKKWLDGKDEKFSTNAYYEDDGEKNMAVIENYIKENGKSWEMFPYFNWCRSLGEGWYAPAMDELKDIIVAINGASGKYNGKYMKNVSKTITKHKGDKLIDTGYMGSKAPYQMYSSTEGDAGCVYTMYLKQNLSSALLGGSPKGELLIDSFQKTFTGGGFSNVFGSRAVHKF